MKRYYIVENDQPTGPFSIEELKSKQLKRSTLVRAEDVEVWYTADKIDDLKIVLSSEPTSPQKITELPSPHSRRSRHTPSSSSPQSQEEQLLSTPIRRPRSLQSMVQPTEPSPLSTAAVSVKSSAVSASKKLKSIKLKASTIKYILISIGFVAILGLIALSGMKYLESSKYDKISLIPVKSGNQWGYINSKGQYVINPQFQDADYFLEGMAKVVSSEGKVGYIGEDGRYIIASEYKDGTPFSDGLAFVVSTGGHITCIDQTGNIKFTIEEAKHICAFREGLARFATAENKYGFIDGSGMVVIKPQFHFAGDFNEGVASILQNGKWGYIDSTGKIVINPQFTESFVFSEGKAFFNNGIKFGYIDKNGNYLINPQFDEAYSFSERMAVIKSGNRYGYIDRSGDITINPQFEMANHFHNGLAAIKQNDTWGFIDKKGDIAITPQFEAVSAFSNGIAFVKSANTWGIVDKAGKYLANPQFEDIKQRPDLIFDPEPYYYIISDYYDTSVFINKLFERVTDDSFDGFNTSSTLQTLLDNAIYGNEVSAASEHRVIFDKPQRITNDIIISETAFNFDNPVYSYSNYDRQYHFDEKITYIKYNLKRTENAEWHLDAIVEALKAEIEKRYKVEMKNFGGFHGYHDSYSGYDEKSNMDFSICVSHDLDLYIGFSQGILARFFEN